MTTVEKLKSVLADAPDRAELEAELAHLRDEIERLAGTLAEDGRGGLRRIRRDARASARSLGRDLRHAEDRALATVRDRPVESAALALLGFGLLLAWFLRR
ncbi:MAG TPA: hypothetical protein PLH75_07140 [Amaricoccus sp.]|uniref:hypothetical protein n=1 Tax=Amaricoccus sp. TaxID=1872485 RepID=UPI001E13485A|nr:hypothetical protein [Amaricoccus sp.]MCB1373886.1 hypothetical protein [Paracoccaceae bacterium]MCC0066315.1 hypothetical protein [Rhodovulum sp.]MCB1401981.1 hypothetical protein [Paracoccaceae bacterium]HPG22546.1 hypothetical protein [Amaricoccus sp.]HRW13652.1 hypothetical protein [Amaricoccus sp.]